MAQQNTGSKQESKAAQIVLSIIIFAGFVALLFVPDTAIFESGLFRQILDVFKQPTGIQFLDIAYYSFTGFYALLLILTVASFFTDKKGSFALNCVKTVIGIVVTVFFIYALVAKIGSPIDFIFRDDKTKVALNSTVIMLAFGLIMLFALSISYYKGRGAAKTISAIVALAYAAFFFYEGLFVGDSTLIELFDINFRYGTGALGTVISYSFIALAFAAAVNFAFALLSLAIRRMGGADIARSVVMFVLSALCFVLLIVDGSFGTALDKTGTLAFLIVSAVQLIYNIVAVVLCSKAAAKAVSAQEEPAEEEETEEEKPEPEKEKEEEPAYDVDEDNQMAMQGLGKKDAPAEEEEPASEEAARANAAFDDAAQISIEDIVAQNQSEEQQAYSEAVRDEGNPSAGQEISEEKEYDYEQARHDGTFNREYSDYQAAEEARRQQAAQAAQQAAQQAQQQFGAQQQPQQPYGAMPYYGYGAGYAQQYAQNAPGYYGGPIPYLPDAFINSLTPAERDEFDKLFISRVYGDNKRLPIYTVGGDNREFFAKIFVFMGRYRSIISEGLLEKIYNYSNSLR